MSARRPWALPLVPLYRAGAALEAALYRLEVLHSYKLQWPVISVGSLSAGGAGKTPVVISLARLLRRNGWQVNVLSRGYGREGKAVERVEINEANLAEAARRFGDEPTMIADQARVPVWVGEDRFKVGQAVEAAMSQPPKNRRYRRAWRDRPDTGPRQTTDEAELQNAQESSPLHVHLLDDGMQHRKLARDFEIVLVTAEDLADSLLPAGNLREPLEALRRADAVVVREEEREDIEEQIRKLTGRNVPLWSIRRRLHFPTPLGVFTAGFRPVAFCGIARPENFASMLADAGCGIVETVAFPDHHAYSEADIDRIVEVARRLQATGLVTTEKDAVKLTPAQSGRLLAVGPLAVVALQAEFIYKAPVLRTLAMLLRGLHTTPSHPAESDTAPQAREAHPR